MLYELHVRDMALIREAALEFGEGLHVLTGETGAGKSLLLGSVGLALGARAGADVIRHGSESAKAELVFAPGEVAKNELSLMDVECDEDGNLILSRTVSEKRGSCRINGDAQPVSKLKAVSGLLIDIHGQHEHQSLLKKSNHIRMLDQYAASDMGDIPARLAAAYDRYKEARRELESQKGDSRQREREQSLAEYELAQIRDAALKEGEDKELSDRYALLSNGRRIQSALGTAQNILSGGGEVSEGLSRAIREVSSVADLDDRIREVLDSLLGAEEELGQAVGSLGGYIDRMDFDERELYEIEKRLDLINTLKQKYGDGITQIEDYARGLEERLGQLSDYEGYLEGLKARLDDAAAELLELSEKASGIRKKAAAALEKAVMGELSELNFLDARFEIRIERLEESTDSGFDDVEFMISMNPGEPLRALSQVASGGELSRIMLALRTVSAVRDGIDTLIFDEIDAGISGVTADMVAKKLSDLSRSRQVICITHLPQILAYADRHYRIHKSAESDTTTTDIEETDEEGLLSELIRLLGGTDSAGKNAAELRQNALKYKGRARRKKAGR